LDYTRIPKEIGYGSEDGENQDGFGKSFEKLHEKDDTDNDQSANNNHPCGSIHRFKKSHGIPL
jgi:hypothetical protein